MIIFEAFSVFQFNCIYNSIYYYEKFQSISQLDIPAQSRYHNNNCVRRQSVQNIRTHACSSIKSIQRLLKQQRNNKTML